MSESLGRAVIEVTASTAGVDAAIGQVRRSINDLGVKVASSNSTASKSIDRYVANLKTQAAVQGMTTRQTELYKLAMRGASDAQLKAADSALKLAERQKLAQDRMESFSRAGKAIGAVIATGLIASVVAFDRFAKSAAQYQDVAEKIGDSGKNIASLAVAAGVSETSMETLITSSNKLTKSLADVNGSGKDAAEGLKALGINVADFQNLSATERIDTVAKAMVNFKDGTAKSAVAMALFGKSGAEMMPFLKELGEGIGRQNILTSEQIALADEYADKQAKLQAQISLYAGAIASDMIPAFNDLSQVLLEIIKDFGGVNSETGKLDSGKIRSFANDAADALAFLVDVVGGVKFAFQSLGTAIGATMASQAQLFKGEFSKAKSILESGAEDIQKLAMQESARDKLARTRAAREAGEKVAKATVAADKPALKYTASRSSAGKAGGEAKAAMDAEIAAIKAAAAEKINALSNAEKILSAKRSAGLVSEKEQYAERRRMLQENLATQEDAILKEIDIVSKQSDSKKKVIELQAQLSKVRADSATNLEVLALQELAANKKIEQSLIDATDAAKEYIATIQRRNAAEIEGMGRGNKYREAQGGRNAIEDRFNTEKAKLDRDLRRDQITREQYDNFVQVARDAYAKELAEHALYIDKKTAKEGDYNAGALEAINNYADEAANVYKQMEDAVSSAFKGMEDALVEFVTTGKLDFKKLVDSIIADMARITIKQNITGPLSQWMGGSSGGGGGGLLGFFSGLFGGGGSSPRWDLNALGGVYSSPSLSAFSGSVVSHPTPFRFARGAGLMGEAGAEGIFPLARGKDGKLGVKAEGAGGQTIINVTVNGGNNAPDVRRAAGQGAREALAAFSGAQRYS